MNKLGAMVVAVIFALFSFAYAQALTANSVKVTVNGTSTLHPWTMTSSKATFAGTIAGDVIKDVKFTMPAKNLKSGKGPMDTNAYKALKADKAPNITFTAKEMALKKGNVTGVLNIAGKAKTVTIPVNVVKAGATYKISGSTKMKMSDFGVVPPAFMMNTVKTGDEVTVTVNMVVK